MAIEVCLHSRGDTRDRQFLSAHTAPEQHLSPSSFSSQDLGRVIWATTSILLWQPQSATNMTSWLSRQRKQALLDLSNEAGLEQCARHNANQP